MEIVQGLLILCLTVAALAMPKWVPEYDARAALLTMTAGAIFVVVFAPTVGVVLKVDAIGVLLGTAIATVGSLYWVGSVVAQPMSAKPVLVWMIVVFVSLAVLLIAMIAFRTAG